MDNFHLSLRLLQRYMFPPHRSNASWCLSDQRRRVTQGRLHKRRNPTTPTSMIAITTLEAFRLLPIQSRSFCATLRNNNLLRTQIQPTIVIPSLYCRRSWRFQRLRRNRQRHRQRRRRRGRCWTHFLQRITPF